MSDILYKYTNLNGAQKTLSNCNLRFTRPSELNDPFDVYIDDLFGMDFVEVIKESKPVLLEQLFKNPELFADKCEANTEQARLAASILRSLPEAERKNLCRAMEEIPFEELYPEFDEMKKRSDEMRGFVIQQFQDYGIFCATKTKDNLLMWAHYADQHRGVVLGFKPDLEKDSFLRLMEPITYSEKRPVFFESAQSLFDESGQVPTQELTKKAVQRLLHTKSIQWSYEEEWRLAIPDVVKGQQNASLLKFWPNELVEVYLGCRMKQEDKITIASLAKHLNPSVAIYSMELVKREYSLFPKEFLS